MQGSLYFARDGAFKERAGAVKTWLDAVKMELCVR
jgi:hypothetical protein